MPVQFSRSDGSSGKKAPRIFTSADKRGIRVEEVNQLFAKAGWQTRNPDKLEVALQNSLFCVTARLFKEQVLIGFVRATSDGVFNATVWDLVVDPSLPNAATTKALLIERLKREVTRTMPQCAISIFAHPQDLSVLDEANFAKDKKGIQAMAWR
ncbi:MAG: hypothetical protein F6K19_36520 [Cyanothece sp. SIO1E1]|nr:hypothetical protein [Cyanothece sp. SIO1E1]